MQVRDIVGHLAHEQHKYRGDVNASFNGFTLDTSSRPVAGRFYLVRDSSWPVPSTTRRRPHGNELRSSFCGL